MLDYTQPDWPRATWAAILHWADTHEVQLPPLHPNYMHTWLQQHPGYYASLATHLRRAGTILPFPTQKQDTAP